MTKKEHTTITELFQVLDLLESLDMQFWLDGGWGVDVLLSLIHISEPTRPY